MARQWKSRRQDVLLSEKKKAAGGLPFIARIDFIRLRFCPLQPSSAQGHEEETEQNRAEGALSVPKSSRNG
jgi:hypothetical protein